MAPVALSVLAIGNSIFIGLDFSSESLASSISLRSSTLSMP